MARRLNFGSLAGVVDAAATAAWKQLPITGRAFLLFILGAAVGDAVLAREIGSSLG